MSAGFNVATAASTNCVSDSAIQVISESAIQVNTYALASMCAADAHGCCGAGHKLCQAAAANNHQGAQRLIPYSTIADLYPLLAGPTCPPATKWYGQTQRLPSVHARHHLAICANATVAVTFGINVLLATRH